MDNLGLGKARGQVALFISHLPVDRIEIITQLQTEFPMLKPNPFSLPLPDDAPPEIPRMIFESLDGSIRIDVSLARVHLVRTGSLDNIMDCLPKDTDALSRVFTTLGVNFVRIGVVVITPVPLSRPSVSFVYDTYMAALGFQGIVEANLGVRLLLDIAGIQSNVWVRMDSLPKSFPGDGSDKVEICVDCNTVAKSGVVLNPGNLANFAAETVAKVRPIILQVVFSEGQQ